MSKGIILLDMPENCKQCRLYYPARDTHTGEYLGGCRLISTVAIRDKSAKPDWCPIRPMPEKAFHEEFCDNGRYDKGWNDCLREIGGIDNDLE